MVKNDSVQGRRKIEMKKITKKNNLKVTFSNRKVFSFGHPHVESTIDQFLTRNPSVHCLKALCNVVEAHRDANIRELNAHLAQLADILEVEKRKGQTLDDVREAGRRQWWWQAPISELGLSELQQLRNALQELKRNVGKQADLLQAAVESRYCWTFLAPNGGETSGLGRERSEPFSTMVKNDSVQGRRKIEMKKIAKKNNLQVTFSKRRSGLFKKASELCTLCGVDIAIIVFSPPGKVFSFGHPHVESTIDRFLTRNPSIQCLKAHCNVVEAHRDANIRELNAHLAQLADILEVEKRKGQTLDDVREAGRRQWWWQAPISELGLSELQQLRNALQELRRNVGKQADLLQAAVESRYCWPFLAPNGVETSGLGREISEVNASSSTTQMHKFDHNLYFEFYYFIESKLEIPNYDNKNSETVKNKLTNMYLDLKSKINKPFSTMVKNGSVQGRRKIEMKKIAKKNNLQVTFSKRRSGLFKKASELCTLCGVDVAIIVFSPAGKVFSFGHPHVESTIDRFLTRNPSVHCLKAHCNVVEAHRDANIRELNAHLAQLADILEVEKRKGQTLDDVREAGRRQWWWQAPISELGLSELQQLRNALQELKKNVGKQADLLQAAVESRYCWPFLAPNGAETSGLGRERSEPFSTMVKNGSVQGRRKIEMKKIAKKNNLQVTFSKRRSGLFKKANELCTLCGVDVAIIVFSPAGKVFSFGHPHVESTIDQVLTRNPSVHCLKAHCNVVEAHRDANIRELNTHLAQLVDILEVEKRKGQTLDDIREAGRRQWWWQAPISELGLSELQQLRNALQELKRNVGKQADMLQPAGCG
ncbi:hypothetical protein GQ457_12G026200 [Hibiscus cannabinus]